MFARGYICTPSKGVADVPFVRSVEDWRPRAAQPHHHGTAHPQARWRRARSERHDGGILSATSWSRFDPERSDLRVSSRRRLLGHTRHLERCTGGGVETRHPSGPRSRWPHVSAAVARWPHLRPRTPRRRTSGSTQCDPCDWACLVATAEAIISGATCTGNPTNCRNCR